jgi:phenylacetate-CoA ligase
LAEAVANISQCPAGHLHVDEDFSYVEFLPDVDGMSRIVGTSFSNRAVSILRYDTGDLARTSNDVCSCGRAGRLVTSLDGRLTDYIVLPGGRKVASLATPFHDADGLREAQLYQAKDGNLVIRYVPISGGAVDLNSLESSLRVRVGGEIKISFEQLAQIPKTKRGKTKLVVSDFQP